MIRYFFFSLLPVFVLSFFLTLYIRRRFFFAQRRKSFPKRELYLALFFGFCASALFLLLTPNNALSSTMPIGEVQQNFFGGFRERLQNRFGMNFIPFYTITNFRRYGSFSSAFINLWGNVFLFIPLGFGFPFFRKKFRRFSVTLSSILFLSLSIEFIQFFVGRSVDIDDVLLNTLGGFIGYLIYVLCLKAYPPRIAKYRR